MKKILTFGSAFTALALLVSSFALRAQAIAPAWNVTGSYVVNMEYLGINYAHDMSLTQDSSGNLTGNGGSPSGANVYKWALTSGTVSGNSIDFLANYTATADAVTPQTVLHVTGTIASDGKISGTWSDNYQGGSRSGSLSTVSGAAVALRTLTVVKAGNGSGTITSSPAGINCGADCSKSFDNNASVTLTATSAAGSSFAGWSGDCTGTGSCVLAMSANKAVTATFTLNVVPITFSISASAGVNGIISPSGSVIVNSGSSQAFTITANSGFHVKNVLVDGSSVGAVATFTFSNVIANHTIAASFEADTVSNGGPKSKDDCKEGGWAKFTNPSFRNQGLCVASVNHQSDKDKEDKDEDSSVKADGSVKADNDSINVGNNIKVGSDNAKMTAKGRVEIDD
jgi:hypothetical protein